MVPAPSVDIEFLGAETIPWYPLMAVRRIAQVSVVKGRTRFLNNQGVLDSFEVTIKSCHLKLEYSKIIT